MASVKSPTVNKLQLGALLRKFRTEADLKQEQLGQAVFPRVKEKHAQSKIARIEAGDLMLHEADLRKMLAHLGVTDPDMIELMLRLLEHSSQRGRWGGYRAAYDETFRKYIDLEEDADRIRGVAVGVVPDLLQCESYVRALFGAGSGTEEVREAAVMARMARTDLLNRAGEDRIFHFVLCESALRKMYGPNREVLREQIGHLVALSRRPGITIQVAPFTQPSANAAMAVLYPFTTLRIPVQGIASSLEYVYLSTPGEERRYLDDKPAVEVYDRLFTRAIPAGQEGDHARRFMQEISREYR